MKTTLGDAKAEIDISESTGIASCDTTRFVPLLNEGQSYLADKGKWWGTYRRLYVCVTGGCITWPAPVANPEGFRLCNEGIPILNLWYEFQNQVPTPDPSSSSGCGPGVLLDRPTSPLHTDATVSGVIRLYPASASDVGKRVLLQGIDANTGAIIRTQYGSTYVNGEYVALESPFATSTFTFAHPGPSGVQKPVTNGLVSAYVVSPSTGDETKIAEWGPSERNPDYRRSLILNFPHSTETCCNADNGFQNPPTCLGITAESIVRMEVTKAAVDSDWLFIGNLQALRHGMVAVQLRRKGNYQAAEIETQEALRILRAELQKYSPKATMRVNMRPHGTSDPRRVFSGFI